MYMHSKNDLFDELVSKYHVQPTLIASTLLNLLVDIRRKGGNTEFVTNSHLKLIFSKFEAKQIPTTSIEQILTGIANEPEQISPDMAIKKFIKKMLSEEDIIEIIQNEIAENLLEVNQKGLGAMGKLMGRIMAKIGGSAEGKIVNSHLKTILLHRIKSTRK